MIGIGLPCILYHEDWRFITASMMNLEIRSTMYLTEINPKQSVYSAVLENLEHGKNIA